MTTRARTLKSQSVFLGVLKYKEEANFVPDRETGEFVPAAPVRRAELPTRWVSGSKEERIARILLDLPEACFRSPSALCDTLRSIYAEIYLQFPDLKERIETITQEDDESDPKEKTNLEPS